MKTPNANQGKNKKITLLLGLLIIALWGCTKERPYDSLDIDPTSQVKPEAKSAIDTTAKYLYVPSSLNSTRTTDATFPMYMGGAKVVTLKFTETALQVVEVDTEDQFGNNPVNSKPVLSIPIAHIDVKCATDADGKCTNKEEVDESKPWAQRRQFLINANQMAVQEISAMPLQIKNLFYNCYQEVGSAFDSVKIEKDNINISVEKSYRVNVGSGGDDEDASCATKIKSLSDLTFKVKYTYSLAKLSSITTPDYKPFVYKKGEENVFGYFDNDTLKLDRDNVGRVDGEKVYLHRWNPNRKVVYHLTENFNKPEHAKIKLATQQAIDNINASLKKAGANLQIELQDALPNMNVGDLRVNSIVMVEEPVNYGILGYGPTAANPLTGEIVHARAAMYLGVIKTGIKRAYEEVLAASQSEARKAQDESQTTTDSSGDIITIGFKTGPMKVSEELENSLKPQFHLNVAKYTAFSKALNGKKSLDELLKVPQFNSAQVAPFQQKIIPLLKNRDLNQIKKFALRTDERKLTMRDAIMMKSNESISAQIMSEHCFMGLDDINIHDLLEKEIEELIKDLGGKPWLQLTEGEKDRVMSTLLPFVWIPTLIHEVGHTLGLRHNFAGSEDKANFYTAEELKEMGAHREFKYSSVMDYGYRATNELSVMGKYDIAALRFGYAEQVELAKPNDKGQTIVSVEEHRATGAELKNYEFCTDEHADVNPNCNRFDEGTNLVEMANHWIKMYEENYLRRNFRNGLSDFSSYDDGAYLSRASLVFDNLRTMFERYESIKMTFGLDDDANEWNTIDFLKDLKEATKIGQKFLVNVLKTPDLLCAVSRASAPNQIIALVPIRDISPFAINCFSSDIQLNPQFKIVGQAGKSFQSRKDRNNPNAFIDQIDVRGIWLDKLLAAKTLVGRTTGISNFDEFTGNFLDIKDVRSEVQSEIEGLLLDEVETVVPIFTTTGQVLNVNTSVSLYSDQEGANSHRMQVPLNPAIQKAMGIPAGGIEYQAKLVDILKRALPSNAQKTDSTSLLNSIAATIDLPVGSAPDDFLQTDVGLNRIFVNQKSAVAAKAVAYKEITQVMNSLGEEKLNELLALIKEKKELPENATDAEKFVVGVAGEAGIERFLQGGFQSPNYYEKILQAMAR